MTVAYFILLANWVLMAALWWQAHRSWRAYSALFYKATRQLPAKEALALLDEARQRLPYLRGSFVERLKARLS